MVIFQKTITNIAYNILRRIHFIFLFISLYSNTYWIMKRIIIIFILQHKFEDHMLYFNYVVVIGWISRFSRFFSIFFTSFFKFQCYKMEAICLVFANVIFSGRIKSKVTIMIINKYIKYALYILGINILSNVLVIFLIFWSIRQSSE